jgi:hypothetical protein
VAWEKITYNACRVYLVFEFKNIKMKTFEEFIRERYAELLKENPSGYVEIKCLSLNHTVQLVDIWQKLNNLDVSGRSEQFYCMEEVDLESKWIKCKEQCSLCIEKSAQ